MIYPISKEAMKTLLKIFTIFLVFLLIVSCNRNIMLIQTNMNDDYSDSNYSLIIEDKKLFSELKEEDLDSSQIILPQKRYPAFQGGDIALIQYISDNLKYPKVAKRKGIEGRVVVRFLVKKDGCNENFRIIQGVTPELDKEALRIAKKLPNFIPGFVNGEVVDSWFTFPITFKLDKEKR